jgi:hypothetical protein
MKELQLSAIEGLSIWEQGRLRQEGLDNAQNLATADVARLVISTAFTINQLMDWIDQAILLVYASTDQFNALEQSGIRCASSFVTAAASPDNLSKLAEATKLDPNGLQMLYLAVQSAANIKLVARFHWQLSIDPARVEAANAL